MNKSGKILITGGSGMLGRELAREFQTDYEVISTGTAEFDVSDKKETLSFIKREDPDIIIHSAALKDVDACEKDQPKAYSVNVTGAENVADAAHKTGAIMVYISTDYVFDGTKSEPYVESDEPNPVNFYGNTKDRAEAYVKYLLDKYFIVRTAWLFGHHGDSFITSMLRLSREQDTLNIVKDKFSTPTFTGDVARQLKILLDTDNYGTYHCSSQGGCSWYEYSLKVFEYADINIKINPIPLKDFPFRAKRPPYSVLDNANLRKLGIDIMPQWEESLERFVKSL